VIAIVISTFSRRPSDSVTPDAFELDGGIDAAVVKQTPCESERNTGPERSEQCSSGRH